MKKKRKKAHAPVCSLRGEHGINKIHCLRTLFPKALQSLQGLVVTNDVDLPLIAVSKWMSTVRLAVIIQTAQCENVDRLCEPRRRLARPRPSARTRVVAPDSSANATP